MNMERFFASLTQWGISIHLDDNGAIRVKGKKEKLTATVVAQLKANKTQIAQWLAQTQPKQAPVADEQTSDAQILTQAQQEAFEQYTLHGLFEVQALEHVHREAIEFAGVGLSYGQLNLQANRLAYYLRQQGLEAESCVAIAMTPGVDYVIAILAVLKAGGAFLPINAGWSEAALNAMLNDGEVCRVLTDDRYLSECEFLPLPVDNLDDEQLKAQLLECAGVNPSLLETQSAFSLATILETAAMSGARHGDGKGVMLEHGNLLSAIKHSQLPDLNASGCWALNYPLTSRFGLMSLFMALCLGGKLVQFQPLHASSTRQLTHLCVDGEQLSLLLHHNPNLVSQVRHLMIVGHQFEHQLLLQLMALRTLPTIRLYGLLEAGFFVGSTLLDGANPLLIGQINKGCVLHLLDEELQAVPQGQQGQIYLSGIGVSRGYAEGWQLTEQYFIPSPFSDDPNEHLIATGDLAIINSDHEATFLARTDQKSYALSSEISQLPSIWHTDVDCEQPQDNQTFVQQSVWHNAPFSTVAQHRLNKSGLIKEISFKGISYVVFVDGFGIGNQLLQHLRRGGLQVVEVRIGEQFAMLRSGVYQLNPTNSDDYHTLFNYLFQLGNKRCAVVHCWSLTLFELNAFSEAIFERLARIEQFNAKGVDSVSGVVNGLHKSQIDCTELTVVSHDLHSVTGLESLLLSASVINGVLAIDSNIDTYHIDITFGTQQLNDLVIAHNAQFIANELMVVERSPVVAFRGRHRWLPSNADVCEGVDVSAHESKAQSIHIKSVAQLVVLSDDAKALSQMLDGLAAIEYQGQMVVLSDEVDIINATWPEQVECLHTLLGDFDSIERRLAQVSKDLGHIDACIVLPSEQLPFAKQVKTILSLESLFSLYPVDSCVLVSPYEPTTTVSDKEPFEIPNGLSNHYYHQLFVQSKFAQCSGNFSCIAYQQVTQLSQRVFIQALLQAQTSYCRLVG